jgi:hypothetical protein
MLVLLALAGRYPDQMREMLEALQPAVERQKDVALVTFFEQYQPPAGDPYARREWDWLLEDVRALLPADAQAPRLSEIPIDNFNLVRSFSFVGDIGYQPGDFPLDGLERRPGRPQAEPEAAAGPSQPAQPDAAI